MEKTTQLIPQAPRSRKPSEKLIVFQLIHKSSLLLIEHKLHYQVTENLPMDSDGPN